MKDLMQYLSAYKKESILAPLFKMLEASFELMVPLVMAYIIDVGIKKEDTSLILTCSGILVLLGLIGFVCSVTAQYYSAKAAIGFATKLRHALFCHIQTLGFYEMDEVGTATMITRLTSDVNQLQTGVNLFLRLFLRSPFVVLGAMIMAFMVDTRAGILFAVVIPLLSCIIFIIMRFSVPLYQNVQKKLEGILSITRETLTGARVIRAFHREEEQEKLFLSENNALMEQQLFVGRVSSVMNPLTMVVVNLGLVVLIRIGAFRVESGFLSQGEVIALINYMSQILGELIKLANLIISLMKAMASGSRVSGMFAVTAQMEEGSESFVLKAKESVVFEHVSFSYPHAKEESLSDISFRVMEGETVGIIGGTGSGKTTLVHLIPRYYDASQGCVMVYGKDVMKYRFQTIRSLVGMVMQKPMLFRGTIADNVRWGKQGAPDTDVEEALILAQAKDFVHSKEGGLEGIVEQQGRNLSGGQKQRLGIARAIIQQPNILILDDSASALDFATEAKLRNALQKQKNGQTQFIVSQRVSSIRHANRILVLEDGRLVGFDTHDNLLRTCPVYQEIYESQQSNRERSNHEK